MVRRSEQGVGAAVGGSVSVGLGDGFRVARCVSIENTSTAVTDAPSVGSFNTASSMPSSRAVFTLPAKASGVLSPLDARDAETENDTVQVTPPESSFLRPRRLGADS